MEPVDKASELLDSMLGGLGFVTEIRKEGDASNPGLQVLTKEPDLLTGRDGSRIDDMQYLVNRLLQLEHPNAPRVRVDVEHYRAMREDRMMEEIRTKAEQVRRTGKPIRLKPLNSYFRRLVHTAFKDDPDIETSSSQESGGAKQITLNKVNRSK